MGLQCPPEIISPYPWTANHMGCNAPLTQLTLCILPWTANQMGCNVPLTQLTTCPPPLEQPV